MLLLQGIVAWHYLLPFVKNGPVNPNVKEIRKEALRHLCSAFRGFSQLLFQLPLKYFQIISFS